MTSTMVPGVHFELDSNNSPSPGHSNRVRWSMHLFRSPTYGFLVGAKDCRTDFNNGLGSDSNSGPILIPQAFI